jgi:DHA2 family multidrug resistance protein
VHFLHLSEHLTSANPNAQALISRVASADALRWGGDSAHGAAAALRQLWSLTFNEAQTQAFADTFLAIMICLLEAMVLIPLMRKIAPPPTPAPDAH